VCLSVFCQRTSDEKTVAIELKVSDYTTGDLSSFERFGVAAVASY
jgi:hypothetical protein